MHRPVFHLNPTGRLANLMIQYMVALKFVHMVPNCRISNMHIPEWGIDHPSIDPDGAIGRVQAEQHIDLTNLAEQVWAQEIQRVEWIGFGQRLENFLPRERYQDVFVSPFDAPMGVRAGVSGVPGPGGGYPAWTEPGLCADAGRVLS